MRLGFIGLWPLVSPIGLGPLQEWFRQGKNKLKILEVEESLLDRHIEGNHWIFKTNK